MPFSAMTMTRASQRHDALQHASLRRRRLGQHGVKGADERYAQSLEHREDVAARLAAEDPELVLEADGVEASGIDEAAAAT